MPASGVTVTPPSGSIPESFPTHDPALAREMVAVAHGNVAKVRELLSNRPGLAKASWDWGYGDWETALGAASHVGHHDIAEILIVAGAPVTIFSAAMLGLLAAVKEFVASSPGVQRVKGPHGISLLAHARAGRATEVVAYLESLGDADPRYRDEALSDEDQAAIVGVYAFGPDPSARLRVALSARGGLVIQRGDAPERNLFHQGGRVFHPSGAETVRISFGSGVKAPELRVEDGPLVVIATRI